MLPERQTLLSHEKDVKNYIADIMFDKPIKVLANE